MMSIRYYDTNNFHPFNATSSWSISTSITHISTVAASPIHSSASRPLSLIVSQHPSPQTIPHRSGPHLKFGPYRKHYDTREYTLSRTCRLHHPSRTCERLISPLWGGSSSGTGICGRMGKTSGVGDMGLRLLEG